MSKDWQDIATEQSIKIAKLEAQLAASEKERNKWRNYKPDNEELAECREQAKARDGTYTNGLAAGHVYMVALEAVIRQRDDSIAALQKQVEMAERKYSSMKQLVSDLRGGVFLQEANDDNI